MNVLHLDCSTRPGSHSRRLSTAVVHRLVSLNPGAAIVRRDLGQTPTAPPTPAYALALSSPANLFAPEAEAAMAPSEVLIRELEAADAVVIGTPMHNFTTPSVLKTWIDQIVRVGRSFAPSPGGKRGLLEDRPVFVAVASGGVFSGEGASQPDFLTPYLRAVLGCIGFRQLHFLLLQGTAVLDEAAAEALCAALLASVDPALVETGRAKEISA